MLVKWIKPLFYVGFAILFCFLCIGYAELNDELSITGTISYSAEAISLQINADLDLSEAQNISASIAEGNGTDTLRLLVTANTGYVLPETFVMTMAGADYTIYTSDGQSALNPAGMAFDSASGILTISTVLLPQAESFTIFIKGEAVQQPVQAMYNSSKTEADSIPQAAPAPNVTLIQTLTGMTVNFGAITTDKVQLVLSPKEGYALPESFTLEVEGSGIAHTIYTAAANSHLNPVGVYYNTADNTVTLQAGFLSGNSCTIYVTGFAMIDSPA